MLQNAKVTAFTTSEVLRENYQQDGGERGRWAGGMGLVKLLLVVNPKSKIL